MIFFDRPFRTQISSLETSGSAGDYAVRRDSTKTLDAVPVMYSATDYSCYLGFKSNSHGWSTGQAVLGVFKNTNAFLRFFRRIMKYYQKLKKPIRRRWRVSSNLHKSRR